MLTSILRHIVVLLFCMQILTACSTLPLASNKFSNLYQHRWINSSHPETVLNINEVVQYLKDYDVVFFGELHGHPAVHLAQMQLLEAMVQADPALTLSMEQFERDTQNYIDDYLAGKIGEKYLTSKGRAWENYPTSYRPLVEFARQHHLAVIAANAPKRDVLCVGRLGLEYLDTLSDENRQHIAQDIDISEGAYHDHYMSFITNNASHGSASDTNMSDMMKKMAEQSYAAQVVRDETMAESIARHINDNPQQRVLHLTGVFHSSQFLGTVERLKKRNAALKIAVIETVPIDNNDTGSISDELDNANILLLVSALPAEFINEEHEQEWSKSILNKRMQSGNNCDTVDNIK